MNRSVFLIVLFAGALALGQQSRTPPESRVLSRRMEREFIEHLRWEILWNHRGIRTPPTGIAKLAVYQGAKSLYFCSRDLGACAEYRMWDRRHLDDRIHTVECSTNSPACKEGRDEMESLVDFVRQRDPTIPQYPEPPQRMPTLPTIPTLSTLESFLRCASISGIMTANLGSRTEIVEHFRQMRPPELDSLKEEVAGWRGGGYSSIIIPCFSTAATSVVTLYGDRPGRGPVIIPAQWDPDEEEWRSNGQIERPGGPTAEDIRRIEELRPLYESLACATVKFE